VTLISITDKNQHFIQPGVHANKIEVIHDPQECIRDCQDQWCPYHHTESWHLDLNGKYFTGPFETKEEAQEAKVKYECEGVEI
jgi:hypothetical protein